jgi:hypothetical protein
VVPKKCFAPASRYRVFASSHLKTDENPQFGLSSDHRAFCKSHSSCKDAYKKARVNKGWTPESLREIPSKKPSLQ